MRKRSTFLTALGGVLVGALLFGAMPAIAGVGDAIYLGQSNSSGNKTTTVKGTVDGPAVKIENNFGGKKAAARINTGCVLANKFDCAPPFATDSKAKVLNFNADYLDGYNASVDFAKSCDKGTIMGYAEVDSNVAATWTDVDGWNCNGGFVQAKKTATGDYDVRFEGMFFDSTVQGMVVHITAVGGSGGTIVGHGTRANGDMRVNTYDNQGTAWDKAFAVSVIDPGYQT